MKILFKNHRSANAKLLYYRSRDSRPAFFSNQHHSLNLFEEGFCMVDYGLLASVSESLQSHKDLKSLTFYTKTSKSTKYPSICLELKGRWLNTDGEPGEAIARINFCVKIATKSSCPTKHLEASYAIQNALDSRSMYLPQAHLANFRKTAHIVDLPLVTDPRTVQLHFQAMIWKVSSEIQYEY